MSTEFIFICAGAGGMGLLGLALALRLGHVPGQGATAGRDIGTQAGRDAVTHHHVTDHQRMLDYFCQAKDLQRTVDLLSEQLMSKEMTLQEYLGEIKELRRENRSLWGENRRLEAEARLVPVVRVGKGVEG
jgi:hypothetical protein